MPDTPITYDMINVGFLLKEAEEFKSIFYLALAYLIKFKSIMIKWHNYFLDKFTFNDPYLVSNSLEKAITHHKLSFKG